MPDYSFTPYFENRILRERPYLTREMCIRVVESPLRIEPQEDDRFRVWAAVPELDGRFFARNHSSDKFSFAVRTKTYPSYAIEHEYHRRY